MVGSFYFLSVWWLLAALVLADEEGGVLLIKRSPTVGTALEYRDPTLQKVYHEKVFLISNTWFDVTLDSEDIVVIADEFRGTISRLAGSRSVVDHENRQRPRSILYNKANLIAWIEGNADESYLAISVFSDMALAPIITQRAPLNVEGCHKASFAASMGALPNEAWDIALVCDGKLHVVRLEYPLPSVEKPHQQLKATAAPLKHSIALTHIVGITATTNGNVYVASSSASAEVCEIVRFKIDLSGKEFTVAKEEKIYDCAQDISRYMLSSVGVNGDHVYFTSISPHPGGDESAIRRFAYEPGSTSIPKVWADTHIVVDRASAQLDQAELFSPSRLRIETTSDGLTRLYWMNTLDGRLRRFIFLDSKTGSAAFHPLNTIAAESSLGVPCPMAAVLIPDNHNEAPVGPKIVFTDYGTNTIRQYRPVLNAEALQGETIRSTSLPVIIAQTASAPTDILYVEKLNMIFWVEPDVEKVVAFRLADNTVVANLTVHGSERASKSQLASVTYLESTGRIYAIDKAYRRSRILSWRAPNDTGEGYLGGGAALEWLGKGSWRPESMIADPETMLFYILSRPGPAIYAVAPPSMRYTGSHLSRKPYAPLLNLDHIHEETADSSTSDKRDKPSHFEHDGHSSHHELAHHPSHNPADHPSHNTADQAHPSHNPADPAHPSHNAADPAHPSHNTAGFLHTTSSSEDSDVQDEVAPPKPAVVEGEIELLEKLIGMKKQLVGGDSKERQLNSRESVSAERLFYKRAGEDALPGGHMWINDGFVHWLEGVKMPDSTVRTSVVYKEALVHVNDAVDESQAAEYGSTRLTWYVTFAAFFKVKERFLTLPVGPRAEKSSSFISPAAAAGGVAGLGLLAIGVKLARRRRIKIPTSPTSKTRLYGPVPSESYSDLSPEPR